MTESPAIIVLAAGLGSRFQDAGHKLSQSLGSSSVLGATLNHAATSGLPLVVVTTKALVEEAARHVARQDIVVLEASSRAVEGRSELRAVNARLGEGAAIAAGVSARSKARGWVVLPADMPLVQPSTLQRVAAALPEHTIVSAQLHGQRGYPIAFNVELYSELVRLQGDEGARRVASRYPTHAVEVNDPGVLVHVDSVSDLERVRRLWAHAEAVLP